MSEPREETRRRLRRIVELLNDTSPDCLGAIDQLTIMSQEDDLAALRARLAQVEAERDEVLVQYLSTKAVLKECGEMQARIIWDGLDHPMRAQLALALDALRACQPFFAEDMPEGPDAPGIDGFATVDYRHAYRKLLAALREPRDEERTEGKTL